MCRERCLSGLLIDDFIEPMLKTSKTDFGPLAHKILQIACFYLIGVAASYIYNRVMVNVTQGTLRNLRNVCSIRWNCFQSVISITHSHGDIMSMYTNDIDTLRQMISQSIPQTINSAITIVSVFVCMVVLSIPLTVVTLLMVGISIFMTKKLAGLSGSILRHSKEISVLSMDLSKR